MANGNTKKNIEATKQAMDELTFATRDFTDEVQKSAKEVFGIGTQARMVTKAFRDIANVTREIDTDIDDILDGTKTLSDLTKSQAKLEQKKKNLTTEYRIALDKAGVSAKDIAKITSGEADLTDTIVDNYGDISKENAKLLDLFDQQLQTITDTEEELGDVADRAAEIESNLGATGTILGGLGGVLKKAGLGDLADKMGLEDAVKSGRQLSASLGGTGKKGKVAAHMISQVGKNFIKAGGPAALLAMAVDKIVAAFKQLDQLSGEVAKGFGVSAAEGEKLVKSMNEAANSSGELDFSTKDLVQAQMQLNQALGTSVKFSAEIAEEFSLIQQRTGLSTEAMSFFAKESIRAGGTMMDQLRTVSSTTEELNAQTGLNLSLKEIQEGVASASKATFLATKGGVKELTEAVFKARQFGITMAQLDSSASSLLDFESSIAAELEAELLTGKQLNLSKARQAALDNDMVTLSQEIAKNVGSAADFQNMNRIQQEAIARSVGMQREDLAAMLLEQETLKALEKAKFESMSEAQEAMNKLIEEGMTMEQAKNEMVKRGLSDTLAAQIASQTRADKMAKFQEKIGDMFMLIAQALTPLIDMLMKVLPPLLKGLQPVFSIVGEIVGLIIKILMPAITMAITRIRERLEGIGKMFRGIIDFFKGAFEIFFGDADKGFEMLANGVKKFLSGVLQFFLAPIQALISGASEVAKLFGGEGFDDFHLATEIGSAIGLQSGGIVTGPTNALIGEGGEPEAVVPLSRAGSMGFGSGSETNMLLKELISAVKAGGTVTLDGQKVGQALTISNYSTQ